MMDKKQAGAEQIRFREYLHRVNGLFNYTAKSHGLNFTAALVKKKKRVAVAYSQNMHYNKY